MKYSIFHLMKIPVVTKRTNKPNCYTISHWSMLFFNYNKCGIFYISIENLGFQMRRMYCFQKKFAPCMLTLVAISIPKSWFLSWTAVTITPTERSAPVAAVYSIRASYCTCRSSFDCIFSLVWHGNMFGYNCFDSIFFFEIFLPIGNDSE